MATDDDDFEKKYRQFTQRFRAGVDQNDAEWRDVYLGLAPDAREAFKRIAADLERSSTSMLRIMGLSRASLLISLPSPRRGTIGFLVCELVQQLEEWERELAEQ